MNLIRININGSMNDLSINTVTRKKILKILNKNTSSKGDGEIMELYRWTINGGENSLICYGWYDGHVGFENKHDLPPGGVSDTFDDDSDKKLLFGDLFITIFSNVKDAYIDCRVVDYANYYTQLFEGFDDCNTSDDESSDEGNEYDINDDFIDDNEIESGEDTDDDTEENEELDIDLNYYSDSDSDYNVECEGEDDHNK